MKCGTNCLHCESGDLCLECHENAEISIDDDSQCQCREGFFFSQSDPICLPCDSNCKSCYY